MRSDTKVRERKRKGRARPAAAKGPGLIALPCPRRLGRQVAYKAAVDFVLALILLVLLAPFLLILGLLIKLTSRGPAIYSQTRLGRNGRPFTIYKLRTMTNDCERLSGAQWSTPGDARVTPLGRILRKTHLDELPQLWNVLRGDMSLVGPRPERPEFIPDLQKAIPRYCERLLVRPGVTGLAQVQLPPDSDLNSVRHKLAYDLYYIRQVSLWLDAKIILCTALQCLSIPFRVVRAFLRLPDRQLVEPVYPELLPQT
ncbi:MAG: sugar transferase [Planctomycetes bacterium]|nr:sugar transferase [Planctomycetota bacterium]